MCAEWLGQLVTLALVFASLEPAVGTEATHPPDGSQDRAPQQKGRLSLQDTGMSFVPVRGGGAFLTPPPEALVCSRNLRKDVLDRNPLKGVPYRSVQWG